MRLYLFLTCLLFLLTPEIDAKTAATSVYSLPITGRRMISTVEHLGREHLRIQTKTAVYLYDPIAGGFSSIYDRDGNDWVAYKDDPAPSYPASAGTSYRGLPNLVYGGDDDGAGHPGFKKCESRVVGRNQIHTVSLSGEWAWTWTFYPNAARLDVIKVPTDRAYWFLYEGPVGGKYQPQSTFWATDTSDPSFEVHDHYQGNVYRANHDYLYFGERQSPVAFFMAQITPGTAQDHVSLLGNAEEGALASTDGMVVAGFGRIAGAKPQLKGNHSFLIGFIRKDPVIVIRPKDRIRIEKIIRRRGKLRDFVLLPEAADRPAKRAK